MTPVKSPKHTPCAAPNPVRGDVSRWFYNYCGSRLATVQPHNTLRVLSGDDYLVAADEIGISVVRAGHRWTWTAKGWENRRTYPTAVLAAAAGLSAHKAGRAVAPCMFATRINPRLASILEAAGEPITHKGDHGLWHTEYSDIDPDNNPTLRHIFAVHVLELEGVCDKKLRKPQRLNPL